jgi:hypothetical protein
VSATAGSGQATVSFTPRPSNGSGITSYTVTVSPGGKTASGAGSPITIKGLAHATNYTFTVAATNGVGTGPPSAPSKPDHYHTTLTSEQVATRARSLATACCALLYAHLRTAGWRFRGLYHSNNAADDAYRVRACSSRRRIDPPVDPPTTEARAIPTHRCDLLLAPLPGASGARSPSASKSQRGRPPRAAQYETHGHTER